MIVNPNPGQRDGLFYYKGKFDYVSFGTMACCCVIFTPVFGWFVGIIAALIVRGMRMALATKEVEVKQVDYSQPNLPKPRPSVTRNDS